MLALKGLEAVIGFLCEETQLQMVKNASFAVGVLAGVSHEARPVLSRDQLFALVERLSWLLFWRDDPDLLYNALNALGQLLPLVQIDANNKYVWERIAEMLKHSNNKIKSTTLLCLKRILSDSDIQCQVWPLK